MISVKTTGMPPKMGRKSDEQMELSTADILTRKTWDFTLTHCELIIKNVLQLRNIPSSQLIVCEVENHRRSNRSIGKSSDIHGSSDIIAI